MDNLLQRQLVIVKAIMKFERNFNKDYYNFPDFSKIILSYINWVFYTERYGAQYMTNVDWW